MAEDFKVDAYSVEGAVDKSGNVIFEFYEVVVCPNKYARISSLFEYLIPYSRPTPCLDEYLLAHELVEKHI